MRWINKYCLLFLSAFSFILQSESQSQYQIWTDGNLGGAIYKQDFGFGDSDVTKAGLALKRGITIFPYSSNVCPPDGSYSIVQKVNVDNCSNSKWQLFLSNDHNPQTSRGRMMMVSNTPSQDFRTIYVDTIHANLCAGTIYEFSAAIINVDTATNCSDFPEITFTIENILGQAQASYTTPAIIPYPAGTSAGPAWKYSVYGFDYTMPSNINSLVIKLSLRASPNSADCNNDFAIDDILFSPVGPSSEITFDGYTPENIVTGLCFQNNQSLGLAGNTDFFYNNLSYQWQQSTDNGSSWQDISGANSNMFMQNFPVADTFLFRMRSSDISTISEPGCGVVSNILKVEVDGIPTNFNVTSNSPVCAGSNLQFTAEGGATYTWLGPNGFYDNISMPHIFTSTLADSGTYYAQIITFGGCKVTDSTHVIIKGIDKVEAGPDTLICIGSSAKLHVTKGTSYEWTPANSLSSSTVQNPVAKPGEAIKYVVKVTSGDGCGDTASVRVGFLNNTEVKAVIAGPDFICFPSDTAKFINNSSGSLTVSHWAFDNGQTSDLKNPLPQIYLVDVSRGTYSVRLTIADSSGCKDTAYHVLKVEDNCYIAVPTAFTPNGDGLNDFLYPLNAYKATNLIFRVFNRLGQKVFETRDWTKKWNGYTNGEPQPLGVYVWTLQYTDENKKEVFLKGSTMLIR